jgi:hypothetical protein
MAYNSYCQGIMRPGKYKRLVVPGAGPAIGAIVFAKLYEVICGSVLDVVAYDSADWSAVCPLSGYNVCQWDDSFLKVGDCMYASFIMVYRVGVDYNVLVSRGIDVYSYESTTTERVGAYRNLYDFTNRDTSTVVYHKFMYDPKWWFNRRPQVVKSQGVDTAALTAVWRKGKLDSVVERFPVVSNSCLGQIVYDEVRKAMSGNQLGVNDVHEEDIMKCMYRTDAIVLDLCSVAYYDPSLVMNVCAKRLRHNGMLIVRYYHLNDNSENIYGRVVLFNIMMKRRYEDMDMPRIDMYYENALCSALIRKGFVMKASVKEEGANGDIRYAVLCKKRGNDIAGQREWLHTVKCDHTLTNMISKGARKIYNEFIRDGVDMAVSLSTSKCVYDALYARYHTTQMEVGD